MLMKSNPPLPAAIKMSAFFTRRNYSPGSTKDYWGNIRKSKSFKWFFYCSSPIKPSLRMTQAGTLVK